MPVGKTVLLKSAFFALLLIAEKKPCLTRGFHSCKFLFMYRSDRATAKNYVYAAIGSALGLGLSPIAPGTFGALLGVMIHGLTVCYLPLRLQFPALLSAFVLVCAANHLLTPWAEEYWQCHDPGHFVLDEVAGYLLIPILFRYGQWWKVALWGFVLFRIFDIFKLIPPARYIDRNIQGSWGILLDDLVSAAYAAGLLHILYRLWPKMLE